MKSTHFPSKKQKKSRRWLAVAGVVLLGLTVAGFFYLRSRQADKNATDPTIMSAKEKAEEIQENDSTDEKSSPQTAAGTTTADEVPASSTATVKITSAQDAGTTVNVEATVEPASGGNCVFSFTIPEGRPVVKQASAQNGTCSIAIADVEFDKLGEWDLDVTYFVNNVKASAQTKVAVN